MRTIVVNVIEVQCVMLFMAIASLVVNRVGKDSNVTNVSLNVCS